MMIFYPFVDFPRIFSCIFFRLAEPLVHGGREVAESTAEFATEWTERRELVGLAAVLGFVESVVVANATSRLTWRWIDS